MSAFKNKPFKQKHAFGDTKLFDGAYSLMLNEFEEDDGEDDDSWWWEEGRQKNNSTLPTPPLETDYSSANDLHKNLAPSETRRPFNSYEQCNRLIIASQSKGELIQRFCDIIDGLTADDEEAQLKLKDMIDSVSDL